MASPKGTGEDFGADGKRIRTSSISSQVGRQSVTGSAHSHSPQNARTPVSSSHKCVTPPSRAHHPPNLAAVARGLSQEGTHIDASPFGSSQDVDALLGQQTFQFDLDNETEGNIVMTHQSDDRTYSVDTLNTHLLGVRSRDGLVFNETVTSFHNYNTYETYETPDHRIRDLVCPPFPGGIIRFILQDDDEIKDRYFMLAQKDASMDDIARFVGVAWHRSTPKLILSVIGSPEYFVPWKKTRLEEDLREGLIQAANSTGMWILTDGLDYGLSRVIGDAVHKEMIRRRNAAANPLKIHNIHMEERLPRLNVFGITKKSSVVYADELSGTRVQPENVRNTGGNPSGKQYDLNPDHTHFILLNDSDNPDAEGLQSFRLGLEMRFTKPVGRPRRYNQSFLSTGLHACSSFLDISTPLIGLLAQGGPPDIDHVLWLLQRKIPVLVIQGSGQAADLIAFAHNEIQQRSDQAYLDGYIKGALMRRVSEAFQDDFSNNEIARNLYRDRIIECVKLNTQDGLTYLTIVNAGMHGVRLTDISRFILTALLKSRTVSQQLAGEEWQEQVLWDLQLTLDWNRPDLARSEIFNKYNIGKLADHIVHYALVRPAREEFIELFMEQGLQFHCYLNHKRLNNLFENPADKDFFITACIEGVLGRTTTSSKILPTNFADNMDCELNRLLYKCTHLINLVNPYELSVNSLPGTYVAHKDVAERRAINTLIIWAALTSRFKLAKVLWKKTEDPMAVALVVSMLLHRLGTDWCKKDLDMRKRTKQAAADFGKMAVSMLSLSYKGSTMISFAALSKNLEDFNNRTVVELARMGENKYFIAHPCCQKWLTQRWYGNIILREIDWNIPFKLPDGLKIYFCVFLLFPILFWIGWQPMDENCEDVEDEDEGEDKEMAMLLNVTSMEDKLTKKKKGRGMKLTFERLMHQGSDFYLPFYMQIYYLWTAPITKFWLNQLQYFLYLMIMSVAILFPGCGDFDLNVTVLCWTVTICVELVRHTIVKKQRYPEMNLTWPVCEIVAMTLYTFSILAIRILNKFVEYISFMTAKFLMSLYLLFFYFRFMAMTFPVSPTLGPMLVSIIIMTKKDFADWMRLFILVLVSGAVTIQAVIYPMFPFGGDSLRQAFARAIFGLFLTKIDDLEGPSDNSLNLNGRRCDSYFEENEIKYCKGDLYSNSTIRQTLAQCPHGSLMNYVVVIPYLFNAKLIFVTLLYAQFSATTSKVYNTSVEIWRYQRYGMIVDFEERVPVPPPFSILCYLFYGLRWLGNYIYRAINLLFARATCCKMSSAPKHSITSKMQTPKFRKWSDSSYWKDCVDKFIEEEQAEQFEQHRAQTQSDSLQQLQDMMTMQQQQTRHLSDRIVQLETNFTTSLVVLEEIKHLIERLDHATQQGLTESKKLPHIFARVSPYKGTLIRRFPVFDKFVAWKVPYDDYDPAIYTKPVSEYPEHLQICVDPDILELMVEQKKRQGLMQEELDLLPPLPDFHPQWNTVTSYVTERITRVDGSPKPVEEVQSSGSAPLSSENLSTELSAQTDHCTVEQIQIEVDRTSWITQDNQPLRYEVDILNLPINPLGRTGLRGRGRFWRFGPNHRVMAVVTRWAYKTPDSAFGKEYLLVDGKKVLECIVLGHPDTEELVLPGGNVYGTATAYSVLCSQFMRVVMDSEEGAASLGSKLDQEDMIRFFTKYATKEEVDKQAPLTTQAKLKMTVKMIHRALSNTGFSASILFRGYIDDPSNTDNAWREAEVWNLHYDFQDNLNEAIKQNKNVIWKEVVPSLRLYGNQNSIVMEAARIHKAYC